MREEANNWQTFLSPKPFFFLFLSKKQHSDDLLPLNTLLHHVLDLLIELLQALTQISFVPLFLKHFLKAKGQVDTSHYQIGVCGQFF